MSFDSHKVSDATSSNDDRHSVKTFDKQIYAIDYSEKNNKLPVFAFETDKFGRRRFMVCSIVHFWSFYNKMQLDKRVHYEVIVHNHNTKLHFDLEFWRLSNRDKDGRIMTLRFVEVVNRELNSEYQVSNSLEDCLILESSNCTKFSVHLVFFRTAFKNNIVINSFLQRMLHSLSDEDRKQFTVKDKSFKETLFVDTQIYSKNRNFCIYLSSKYGSARPLFLADYDISTRDLQENFASNQIEFQIFRRSMVTNIDEDVTTSVLSPSGEMLKVDNSNKKLCTKVLASSSVTDLTPEFQKANEFIMNLVHPTGTIRKWFSTENFVRFEIQGNKYCYKAGRCHSGNNIFFTYIRSSGVIEQNCYSEKCFKLPGKKFLI